MRLYTAPTCRLLLAPLLGVLVWCASALATTLPSASGEPLAPPQDEPILQVAGLIGWHNHESSEAHFDDTMLAALPARTLYTSTVVTDGRHRFDGVLMRDLLQRVGAQGDTVTAIALNRYTVDIPRSDFERYDVLLATHMDGKRLQPEDKGPLWIIYPRDDHRSLQDIRYDYRWVWQLERLVVK